MEIKLCVSISLTKRGLRNPTQKKLIKSTASVALHLHAKKKKKKNFNFTRRLRSSMVVKATSLIDYIVYRHGVQIIINKLPHTSIYKMKILYCEKYWFLKKIIIIIIN